MILSLCYQLIRTPAQEDKVCEKIMKNSTKFPKLIINEVDCYIGNAHNFYEYATSRAVQHQIMLVEDNTEIPIGRRNAVTDSDRGERIVFETEVSPETAELWKDAVIIKNRFKSEICDSMEEFKIAAEYNKPLRKQIEKILIKIYLDINIKMPVNYFINLSIY